MRVWLENKTHLIIEGEENFNNAGFVDTRRAIPVNWVELVPVTDIAKYGGYPVVITISPGLGLHSIEHIQLIEKLIDEALLKAGYSRSETEKGAERVILSYYQCAVIEI